jgi:bacterioferritin-associated ferredoxin
MYVCLCAGVSSQTVADTVDAGASTSKEVADRCGAGTECGRCRRTVRAIIDARRGAGASVRGRAAQGRPRSEEPATHSEVPRPPDQPAD